MKSEFLWILSWHVVQAKTSTDSMAVDRLPDFSSSLRYCISAQKNLIYIFKKQSDNAIDTIRQSNIIKNMIDSSYQTAGVSCHIVDDFLKEGLDDVNPDSGCSARILVIPNILDYGKDQQVKMVKMIERGQSEKRKTIFIGMVPWDIEKGKEPIITIRDWLRHRFWFACFAPNEQQILTTDITENIPYRNVHCSPMIRRYILDIMVHLRMHRFVDITKGGGVQTMALNDVITLSQLISKSKFQKSFLTPEHVKMASLWYFPLHIDVLKDSSMDTTVLYGSKPQMIDDFLEKLYNISKTESAKVDNPLFLESLIVQDVLRKVVPPA